MFLGAAGCEGGLGHKYMEIDFGEMEKKEPQYMLNVNMKGFIQLFMVLQGRKSFERIDCMTVC